MSVAITVDATRLYELTDQIRVRARTANKVAGRAVQVQMRTHLMHRNRTHPNKLGGRRTNYWRSAAQSITVDAQSDGSVVVAVTQPGIGLHYHGGTVKPVRAKMLAIPVAAEAHGKRPREFSGLEVVFWKRGGRLQMGLARKQTTRRAGRQGAAIRGQQSRNPLLFVLKDSVTIQPDADVLPSEPALARTVETAIRDLFDN